MKKIIDSAENSPQKSDPNEILALRNELMSKLDHLITSQEDQKSLGKKILFEVPKTIDKILTMKNISNQQVKSLKTAIKAKEKNLEKLRKNNSYLKSYLLKCDETVLPLVTPREKRIKRKSKAVQAFATKKVSEDPQIKIISYILNSINHKTYYSAHRSRNQGK